MSILTIHQGLQTSQISFDPPARLSDLLAQTNVAVAQPCGGRGVCGKCVVSLEGDVSVPNDAEALCGTRLSCQALILGDAAVTLPVSLPLAQIAGGTAADRDPASPMSGCFGAAIDIGTTTLALLLYDLKTGRCIGSASMLNPQTSVAADVIGRIDAAMHGKTDSLRQQIEGALSSLMAAACAQAGIPPIHLDALVLTGNTTMLYLLTGRDPTSLSRAPFLADCLFGGETRCLDRAAYLPDCLHAFVGADTTCAILAAGMTDRSETALLCDVGTNGELALWHHGQLYIASTAAGPAFEGAGISCGCSSVPGAIDRVDVQHGQVACRTIGNSQAVGVCGSGLVDAIAVMLEREAIDETGYLEDDVFPLRDGISLNQADIRAVQLAKAATHAGIISLLHAARCSPDDVSSVYLAGGFGSHLNLRSAVRIGLIPAALAEKVQVIGNAALDGAAILLMDTSARQKIHALRQLCQHVRLDGNPEFSERYIEAMMFDE